ncbi:hypothetical protein ES703_123657 [subsurface metagenome]
MAKEYEIIHIDQLTRMSDTQGIEPYYRHRIKTKGGLVFTIDVDEKDFTPEKVAPILLEAAQNADKILKLGG